MKYNETEIELMKKLDRMYMATIRAHLKYKTDFTKGQVSGAEVAYLALALAPAGFGWSDVDDAFRGE
jgi:hypothetical protein